MRTLVIDMQAKDATAAASAPAMPPDHFAVNVPLPSIVLPELIVRRESDAAVAEIGGVVLLTSQRDDGTFVVKVSVGKQYAISLYKKQHSEDGAPEAKAVGAMIVKHVAEIIFTHLKKTIEMARAAAESSPPEGKAC